MKMHHIKQMRRVGAVATALTMTSAMIAVPAFADEVQPGTGTPTDTAPTQPGTGTPTETTPTQPGTGTPTQPGTGTPTDTAPTQPGTGTPTQSETEAVEEVPVVVDVPTVPEVITEPVPTTPPVVVDPPVVTPEVPTTPEVVVIETPPQGTDESVREFGEADEAEEADVEEAGNYVSEPEPARVSQRTIPLPPAPAAPVAPAPSAPAMPSEAVVYQESYLHVQDQASTDWQATQQQMSDGSAHITAGGVVSGNQQANIEVSTTTTSLHAEINGATVANIQLDGGAAHAAEAIHNAASQVNQALGVGQPTGDHAVHIWGTNISFGSVPGAR